MCLASYKVEIKRHAAKHQQKQLQSHHYQKAIHGVERMNLRVLIQYILKTLLKEHRVQIAAEMAHHDRL